MLGFESAQKILAQGGALHLSGWVGRGRRIAAVAPGPGDESFRVLVDYFGVMEWITVRPESLSSSGPITSLSGVFHGKITLRPLKLAA